MFPALYTCSLTRICTSPFSQAPIFLVSTSQMATSKTETQKICTRALCLSGSLSCSPILSAFSSSKTLSDPFSLTCSWTQALCCTAFAKYCKAQRSPIDKKCKRTPWRLMSSWRRPSQCIFGTIRWFCWFCDIFCWKLWAYRFRVWFSWVIHRQDRDRANHQILLWAVIFWVFIWIIAWIRVHWAVRCCWKTQPTSFWYLRYRQRIGLPSSYRLSWVGFHTIRIVQDMDCFGKGIVGLAWGCCRASRVNRNHQEIDFIHLNEDLAFTHFFVIYYFAFFRAFACG